MQTRLSLSTRLTLMVGILLLTTGGIIGSTLWVTNAQKSDGLVISLAGRQRMLIQRYAKEVLEEATVHQEYAMAKLRGNIASTQITADRKYYTKNVISKLKKEWKDFKASENYGEMHAAIPLPATFVREVSESIDESAGFSYQLLSKWNVNETKGLRDDFHRQAWDALTQDPATPYVDLVPEGEGIGLRYATADIAIAPACVSCHNAHPNSPKTDFQLHDLMGMLVVSVPITQDKAQADAIAAAQHSNTARPSSNSRKLFESTLAALRYGGETFNDLAMRKRVTVPEPSIPEITKKLIEVEAKWKSVVQSANTIGSASVASPAYNNAQRAISRQANDCLEAMNAVVGLYQSNFEAKVAMLATIQYISGFVALLAFLSVITYIRLSISRPLRNAVRVANAVADGDLTHTCTVTSSDEIGQLSFALNTMCANLKNMVKEISGNAGNVSNSAGQLTATAAQLAGGANQTSDQSALVSAAAEEMSINMSNMANSSDQMTINVKTVAAAVEEMTASIAEVAKNADEAAGVANDANRLAEVSNECISQLGTAADEIGKVIETIQDIAEQTNLLALNATIEAARAGDAGKGFAVVATEVKELAKQTAGATEDIRRRIEGIQSSTSEAVQSIGEIGNVIRKVNDVSRAIASAVEEQSITTKEIAQNVAQTATDAETVSRGVTETATASQEITQNITKVDKAAKQGVQGATLTQEAGRELSNLAEQLRQTVGKFQA
ncbi:MAG: methyl-accepting chemotaxis protein [Phycisphaerae bacterium]